MVALSACAYPSENLNAGVSPRPIAVAPPSYVRLARFEPREHPPEEVGWIGAALRGDRDAQRAIWKRYLPLVRSKLRRALGAQDVDDHAQEVFLRLFEHLPQLRDPAALRSFIIGITLRIAGTELRRRRCRAWLGLTPDGTLPEPCTFDDGGDMREVVSRLLAILNKLAPESCRVFELRFIHEKELSEVARSMNVSLATAKRHIARVRACVSAMAEREPALAGYAPQRLSSNPSAP